MEFELSETYRFDPSEYDATGRRIKDEVRFRDVIKEFEIDFHRLHRLRIESVCQCKNNEVVVKVM